MRTTWKELKEMIENEGVCNDTQIVVKVEITTLKTIQKII